MSDDTVLNSEQIKWIQVHLKQALNFHHAGDLDSALTNYLKILKIDPEHADGNHLAGLALLARKNPGDLNRSLEYLLSAIHKDNGQSTFYNDLGNAYWNLGRINEASEAFTQAIKLDCEFVQPRFNLANCYWSQGQFKQALQAYADTLMVNKEWDQARYMLGNCEYTLGNSNAAISIFRDVILRRPDYVDAQLGLAYALLRIGQWREGWHYFESRLQFSEFAQYHKSTLPQWDGSDIQEKSLVVFAEQGIGDALHFVRYLSQVRPKVGQVVLVCDCTLHKLFSRNNEINNLLDRNMIKIKSIDEEYDYRVSMMSLPNLFQTKKSMSWEVPYLESDKRKSKAWESRIRSDKFNVGLVWAGNPSQKDDKFRSCKLVHLLPLIELSQVQFYSLQVGNARDQIKDIGHSSLIDIADDLNSFDDTAAVIDVLDLVISVDTAVSHLAGALGKPVWTMLWYSHCWRYLETRTDSPWYPSMRLFRQREFGDWAHVVEEIVTALMGENVQKNSIISID